jgi:hypothetical protein
MRHQPRQVPLQQLALEAARYCSGGKLANPICSSTRVTLTAPMVQVATADVSLFPDGRLRARATPADLPS